MDPEDRELIICETVVWLFIVGMAALVLWHKFA